MAAAGQQPSWLHVVQEPLSWYHSKAVLNPGLDSAVVMHAHKIRKYYYWHSSPLAYRDLQVAIDWGTEAELLITQINNRNTLQYHVYM